MAGLRGFIALDICLVYGVCVGSAAASAPAGAAAAPGVTPADVADARALRALEDAQPPTGPLADLVTLLLGPAP